MHRYSDVIVALAVVAVVGIMIVPLPAFALDLLLAMNLTAALVILLVSLYTAEPLQFSVFPSLLLVTTLMRLGLNVSSTRLILLTGDAGQVIRQFGNFVVGGNAAVGFVVFLILVVIQFVVITRGAERVSEVAARFTLDAMPGKQMAIDADLNAGLIGDVEARSRRRTIEQEADFYGAMDGASKFVKGDAVAGLIITAVNLVGGLLVGVFQQGMAAAQALSHFSLLTVGDGLVTQIPALLISTATGIVVTRAAGEGGMGQDLVGQLVRQPRVMLLAGGVMAALSAVPGLPTWPFLSMAGLMGALGYTLVRLQAVAPVPALKSGGAAPSAAEERRPESVVSLLQVDPLEVELGYALVTLADGERGGDLMDRVALIRRQVALDLGLILPYIRVRDNMALAPSQYVIKLRGVEVGQGELLTDHYLAMDPGGGVGDLPGIPTREPAFGLPALWIAAGDRERAELAGYTVVDPTAVVATHLTEVIKAHGHELLGRQEVKAMVDLLRDSHPALVEELTPRTLSLGEMQKVLQNLLREGVSVRDLVGVFEAMADYGTVTKDLNQLTEYVRMAMGRSIIRQLGLSGKVLRAITLHPELERTLDAALNVREGASALGPPPESVRRLVEQAGRLAAEMAARGEPPVLVTGGAVRPYLRRLVERALPKLAVLSVNEIEASLQLEAVGVVTG